MRSVRFKRPNTALVVSRVALFVALEGPAEAVVESAVPLATHARLADNAKHAVVAENAKKLRGLTATQIAGAGATAAVQVALSQSPAGPRAASTAAGLITIRTATVATIGVDSGAGATVSCQPDERVMGGGYNPNFPLFVTQSYPIDSSTWRFFFFNYTESSSPPTTIYATCLK